MNITMIDSRLTHCTQLETFITATDLVSFTPSNASKRQTYQWIKDVLTRFNFRRLKKGNRGMVRHYIQKITGYSVSQLTRLIRLYLSGRLLVSLYQRNSFPVRYSPTDIALLCKTDNVHSRLNAHATKEILIREYDIFKKEEYKTISQISSSHIYNLRKTSVYQSRSLTFTSTQAVQRRIGERRKPEPQGKPGYIRIDTVHQGDRVTDTDTGKSYEKGVYHINSIDEVTQWQIVAAVEQISESYLEPILKLVISQYPFVIIEFHADNGSEYINHTVVKLLNKLLIKLTKSRSRQTNDNALVEGKNGSVIRKHMGYFYINQKYAPDINDFYMVYFNPYLNFHRPCGFPTLKIDTKGKQKKVYTHYRTPYNAFTGISEAEKFLKPGITLQMLVSIALKHSDNEWAAMMETKKQKLFDRITMNPIDF